MDKFSGILKIDKELRDEVFSMIEGGENIPTAKRLGISNSTMKKALVGPVNEFPRAEAMIMVHLRPALLIRNNRVQAPDSQELRKRLLPYLPKIESRVPSVGRIDFKKMGKPFGGTGWMITEDILVTNRHVALEFVERKGQSIVVRKNPFGDTIEVYIDFKEEYVGSHIATPQFEIPIEKVLYMTDKKKTLPDIAFIKIGKNAQLPHPIPISDVDLKKSQFVSVIGYPAYDPDGIISSTDADKVFGGIYEVKRCSPGEVVEFVKDAWYFNHDCTTLGGNSGSVVIDNSTGAAVGLHFMGEVQKSNYAVKAKEILKHLKQVSNNFLVSTIKPLETKEIDPEIDEDNLESPVESYDDREGFDEMFLGSSAKINLPIVVKGKADVVSFKTKKTTIEDLKYHHFSVVYNKKRKMPFFSACNIDGKLSKRGIARTTWRFDSRIPKEIQILKECYGRAPKFSRGHMTRKEDPIWGDLVMAKAACADTFHATNICPQMQPFNAPVWLALEDYALEHARQDDMKISVITGPVFKSTDPTKYGIKIPVEFFKVIAFIHDKTKKLCVTGYTVSQESFLSNEEFVFGQFNAYQVAIKTIERKTGLSFGSLSKFDPIKREEAVVSALASVADIRF